MKEQKAFENGAILPMHKRLNYFRRKNGPLIKLFIYIVLMCLLISSISEVLK